VSDLDVLRLRRKQLLNNLPLAKSDTQTVSVLPYSSMKLIRLADGNVRRTWSIHAYRNTHRLGGIVQMHLDPKYARSKKEKSIQQRRSIVGIKSRVRFLRWYLEVKLSFLCILNISDFFSA